MRRVIPAIVGGLLLAGASAGEAQTLRGSRVAMQRQNSVAREQDYTFLATSGQVQKFVDLGLLVPVRGNGDYQLKGVSHPYARPALKTFVERLARQYHGACGERLVVTSLTRPTGEQPRNASDLSVHPAGMAVDLRISNKRSCQRWLERTLLSLEDRGVLDATREQRPPHFHVAVFPERYLAYVAQLGGTVRLASTRSTPAEQATAAAIEGAPETPGSAAEAQAAVEKYRVNRGDSLWTIARRYGTTVALIKELNNLRGSRIAAGQVHTVPVGNVAP